MSTDPLLRDESVFALRTGSVGVVGTDRAVVNSVAGALRA